MKVVYVAHPLGAGPDRETNRQRASRWCAWVMSLGHAPMADWIVLSGQYSETPDSREAGLAVDVALVARCDEVWLVGGRISPGMALEAETARKAGIPVVDKTDLGPEPPGLAHGGSEALREDVVEAARQWNAKNGKITDATLLQKTAENLQDAVDAYERFLLA